MKKILIIDDQNSKYEDIKRCFNMETVEVDWFRNHYDVDETIENKNYDLVILDVCIEDHISKNSFIGITVLNELFSYVPSTPVIVLTQYMDFDFSKPQSKKIINNYYQFNNNYANEFIYDFDSSKKITRLSTLHDYLSNNFNNYLGCVLYRKNHTSWINNLNKLIYKIEDEI